MRKKPNPSGTEIMDIDAIWKKGGKVTQEIWEKIVRTFPTPDQICPNPSANPPKIYPPAFHVALKDALKEVPDRTCLESITKTIDSDTSGISRI